jgi:hypothetical protein
MSTIVRYSLAAMGVAALVGAAGCAGEGEGASDRPQTVPVTGSVTYNGQPVDGATVTFSPDVPIMELASKHGAFGTTDAEGKFTLKTFEDGDGAVPGTYRVSIAKYDRPVSAVDPNFNEETDYEPPDENAAPVPPPKSLIPEKYASIGKSGLTETVKADGENTFDYVLAE